MGQNYTFEDGYLVKLGRIEREMSNTRRDVVVAQANAKGWRIDGDVWACAT